MTGPLPEQIALRRMPDVPGCPPRIVVAGWSGSASSERALALAAGRAGPEGRLVVVHATPSAPRRLGNPHYGRDVAHVRRATRIALAEAGVPDPRSVPIEAELAEGDPVDALLEAAARHGADEIVIGRGRRDGRLRPGPAWRLVRGTDRPVVVVPG